MPSIFILIKLKNVADPTRSGTITLLFTYFSSLHLSLPPWFFVCFSYRTYLSFRWPVIDLILSWRSEHECVDREGFIRELGSLVMEARGQQLTLERWVLNWIDTIGGYMSGQNSSSGRRSRFGNFSLKHIIFLKVSRIFLLLLSNNSILILPF